MLECGGGFAFGTMAMAFAHELVGPQAGELELYEDRLPLDPIAVLSYRNKSAALSCHVTVIPPANDEMCFSHFFTCYKTLNDVFWDLHVYPRRITWYNAF